MREAIAKFLEPPPVIKTQVELLVDELTERAKTMPDDDNNLLMRAAVNLQILREENRSTWDRLKEIARLIRLSIWVEFA